MLWVMLAMAPSLQLQVIVVFISPLSVGAVTAHCPTLLEAPQSAQGVPKGLEARQEEAKCLGKQLLNGRLLVGSRV